MIGQFSDLNERVEHNVQSLMKVAEIQEDWKLTDIDLHGNHFSLQPWTFFGQLSRLGKNYSAKTRLVLESLYHSVENTTNEIVTSVHLNVVLLPNKNQISYSEQELFSFLRHLLSVQTDWLEKSISGLMKLDKAYGSKEKKYVMLAERAQCLTSRVRNVLGLLDDAHRKLSLLHVLALPKDTDDPEFESDPSQPPSEHN